MNHYLVIYTIKSKVSSQPLEENCAVFKVPNPSKFSPIQIKNTLLETHGFNQTDNYVRIENVCMLGASLPQGYASKDWSVLGE